MYDLLDFTQTTPEVPATTDLSLVFTDAELPSSCAFWARMSFPSWAHKFLNQMGSTPWSLLLWTHQAWVGWEGKVSLWVGYDRALLEPTVAKGPSRSTQSFFLTGRPHGMWRLCARTRKRWSMCGRGQLPPSSIPERELVKWGWRESSLLPSTTVTAGGYSPPTEDSLQHGQCLVTGSWCKSRTGPYIPHHFLPKALHPRPPHTVIAFSSVFWMEC